METTICQLDAAAGRTTRCPGDACPFWKDNECVVAPLRADLSGNSGLVDLLVGLRASLVRHGPPGSFREFHPPGLA
jgi:hypothetical protein